MASLSRLKHIHHTGFKLDFIISKAMSCLKDCSPSHYICDVINFWSSLYFAEIIFRPHFLNLCACNQLVGVVNSTRVSANEMRGDKRNDWNSREDCISTTLKCHEQWTCGEGAWWKDSKVSKQPLAIGHSWSKSWLLERLTRLKSDKYGWKKLSVGLMNNSMTWYRH